MKKLIMTVFAAVMAVAVQAAQFNWSDEAKGFVNDNGQRVASTGSFSLIMTVQQASDAAKTWFTLGTAEGKTVSMKQGSAFGDGGRAYFTIGDKNGDSKGIFSVDRVQSHSAKMTFQFNKKINGLYAVTMLPTWYNSNGQLIAGDGFTFDNVNMGELADFNSLTVDENVALGDLKLEINNEGEVKVVPEPTALALLALGVAGLALKRRAA